MGLALDTKETFDFVLNNDKPKPAESRPTFVFRYPSYRRFNAMANLFDDSWNSTDPSESFAKALAGAKLRLVDWKNVTDDAGKAIPFNADDLDDVMSMADILEVRERLLGECTVDEVAKKKSLLQSQSNTAASANAKANDVATAPASETPKATPASP